MGISYTTKKRCPKHSRTVHKFPGGARKCAHSAGKLEISHKKRCPNGKRTVRRNSDGGRVCGKYK